MSGNYINRQDVLNDIADLFTICHETLPNECGHHFITETELNEHYEYVKNLPIVNIAAPRWVICEDEMPKVCDYYFAFTEDAEAFVCEYIPSVDQWWNGYDLILNVTHWMPIEPPKEE